ncbi:hypothetical protein ScPMuIL_005673 [Solemya velum]
MGLLMGKVMDENLKKSQDFMLATQKLQLERQLQMQNQMRERMMAMQIGRARELFYWLGSFYTLATLGMLAGFERRRSPGMLVPFVPLTFIVAYQYDMAFGTKMTRIREEADKIMSEEGALLALPHDLPTFDTIEAARLGKK